MDWFNSLWLSIVLFLWIGASANGQTCCSGGVPLSGNLGSIPLQKGQMSLSLVYDYHYLSRLKDGKSIIPESDRRRKTHSSMMEFSWTATSRISINAFLSYVMQERLLNNHLVTSREVTRGLGDWVLMTGFLLLDNPSFRLYSGVGTKFPTGKNTIRNHQDILLSPDLQPGTGAFDGIINVLGLYSPSESQNSMYASLVYRYTGTNHNFRNSDSYRFGNEIYAKSGISSRFFWLNNVWNSTFELAYRNVEKDRLNQETIPSTGGQWLFLNSAISFFFSPSLALSAGLNMPLMGMPEGIQLSPSYRFNGGITWVIGNRNLQNINLAL